jgi:hypothetical protein
MEQSDDPEQLVWWKRGGVFTDNGNFSITNSTISNNMSGSGGGIAIGSSGDIIISNSTINNNTGTSWGGGITSSGTLTIHDSTINGNTNVVFGGGGINNFGILNIFRSTISHNSTTGGNGGGGIHSGNQLGNTPVVNLTNVTISHNEGEGLNFNGSQNTLNFVTVYGNIAPDSKGSNYHSYDSSTTFKHVILQSDSGSNCEIGGDGITSAGFNLVSDDSCNLNGTADLQNTDAQLGPLKNNGGPTLTHLPKVGSPALDGGQCVAGISNDQRGVARPQGGTCDRGAVERTADDVDGYFVYLPVVIK